MLGRQPLALLGVVDRADRLARGGEGRVVGIDADLGQQRGQRCGQALVAQRLLQDVADHPLALGAEDVERVGADTGVGGGLQREQADLRAVAVGHDDLVAATDHVADGSGRGDDVGSLGLGVGGLAAAQQRVAAEGDDDAHQCSSVRWVRSDSSACSVGRRLAACCQTADRGPSMTSAVDLLAAVSRQAMEEHGVRPGVGHERRGDLVGRQLGQLALGLGLLAHRDPDVGVDGVGTVDGLGRSGAERDRAARLRRGRMSPGHDVRIGHPLGRCRDGDMHPGQRTGFQQRVRDVVAVADVGELETTQFTEALPEREQVGQRLAWVMVVGQRVDDRDARRRGQLGRRRPARTSG